MTAGVGSLIEFLRRLRIAQRTFPKHYGWRLMWRWAKDNG